MQTLKVAVFPDNFAKYRVPAFRRIAQIPGVELTVYSSTKGPSRGNVNVARPGIDYFETDPFTVCENKNYLTGPHILWTEGLLGSVVQNKYDVVIGWGEVQNFSVWMALLWGKIRGRSVIIWTHGAYGNEKFIKKHLRILQCRLATAVFLYGNKAKMLLRNAGVPEERLHVVYNSLDYPKQRTVRNSLPASEVTKFRDQLLSGGSDDNTKMLIYAGSLQERKRADIALVGLELLRKQGNDYRLIIIGDGPKLESYKRLVEEHDLDDYVVFKQATYSEDELARYFMSADLAVCPGAIGLLAVHAFAYGLPVCTHDGTYTRHGPEHEVVVHGKTGCIFREGDVEDFAATIEEWFAQPRDRRQLAEACIEEVERSYNPDTQAEIIQGVFAKIGSS